jgi:hypothetical protein
MRLLALRRIPLIRFLFIGTDVCSPPLPTTTPSRFPLTASHRLRRGLSPAKLSSMLSIPRHFWQSCESPSGLAELIDLVYHPVNTLSIATYKTFKTMATIELYLFRFFRTFGAGNTE